MLVLRTDFGSFDPYIYNMDIRSEWVSDLPPRLSYPVDLEEYTNRNFCGLVEFQVYCVELLLGLQHVVLR